MTDWVPIDFRSKNTCEAGRPGVILILSLRALILLYGSLPLRLRSVPDIFPPPPRTGNSKLPSGTGSMTNLWLLPAGEGRRWVQRSVLRPLQ